MPGLMTQPTSPAEVYIDSRLRDEPPETATERARHAYQIHHPQRLSEELAGAEEAYQVELARRKEEAEAPPEPEPEPEPEPLSLDARLADAKRHRVQLAEARGRLSLPALTDEAVCAELSVAVADKEANDVEIEHLELALKEKDRLAPIEQAQREEQAKALAQAEKLAARSPALARAVDKAAAGFAAAVREHRQIARRERELRVEAGTMRADTFGNFGWGTTEYENSLRFHLVEAGVGDAVERAPSRVQRPDLRPMAEAEK